MLEVLIVWAEFQLRSKSMLPSICPRHSFKCPPFGNMAGLPHVLQAAHGNYTKSQVFRVHKQINACVYDIHQDKGVHGYGP